MFLLKKKTKPGCLFREKIYSILLERFHFFEIVYIIFSYPQLRFKITWVRFKQPIST